MHGYQGPTLIRNSRVNKKLGAVATYKHKRAVEKNSLFVRVVDS